MEAAIFETFDGNTFGNNAKQVNVVHASVRIFYLGQGDTFIFHKIHKTCMLTSSSWYSKSCKSDEECVCILLVSSFEAALHLVCTLSPWSHLNTNVNSSEFNKFKFQFQWRCEWLCVRFVQAEQSNIVPARADNIREKMSADSHSIDIQHA